MKTSLVTFALFLLVGVVHASTEDNTAQENNEIIPPRCDYGKPAAHAPEELSQFAFLIGDYQIEAFGWFNNQWYTNPNATHPPRWNGYYGLQGMAIIDEWFNLDPGLVPETNRGVNVRMYDPDSEEWKMMWVSNAAHVVQDLRAKVIDGKLTMWQVYPERPNFKAVFEVVDENRWHRIEYKKDDKGEWQPAFKLAATRIPCS